MVRNGSVAAMVCSRSEMVEDVEWGRQSSQKDLGQGHVSVKIARGLPLPLVLVERLGRGPP